MQQAACCQQSLLIGCAEAEHVGVPLAMPKCWPVLGFARPHGAHVRVGGDADLPPRSCMARSEPGAGSRSLLALAKASSRGNCLSRNGSVWRAGMAAGTHRAMASGGCGGMGTASTSATAAPSCCSSGPSLPSWVLPGHGCKRQQSCKMRRLGEVTASEGLLSPSPALPPPCPACTFAAKRTAKLHG